MKDKIIYSLLAFLTVAVWGITFISTKVLIGAGLGAVQIFFLRFIVAYLGIWVMSLGKDKARRLWAGNVRDELRLAFLGVTGGSLYFYTENTALGFTQACNVSFIVCSAPLLTTLLTMAVKRFFKGEMIDGLEDVKGRWPLALGTVLAMAGMLAVLFDGNVVALSATGDVLAFCAALCWGFYSLLAGQMTSRYGTFFTTRKVFFYGLVSILPFVWSGGCDVSVLLLPEVWGNLLFLSLIASLACFAVWNQVVMKLGNVTSTNFIYLNPLFTLLFASIFLSESLTIQSALGCVSILAGVVVGGIRTNG